MLNLTFSADWELSEGDRQWLAGYVEQQAAKTRSVMRRVCALHDKNYRDFSGMLIGITLLPGDFDAPTGGVEGVIKVSGDYYDPSVFGYHFIRVNWTREFGDPNNVLYQRIISHELGHALAWEIFGAQHYGNWAHGRNAKVGSDLVMEGINKLILDAYPVNHSSFPGTIP